MKRAIALMAFLCLSLPFLSAQNPSRVTIKGTAVDSFENIMSYATVMLLNPVDTTLVNFTRSDEKGSFSFKNVKNRDYLLKISYIGYVPFQLNLEPAAAGENELGNLYMKPISNELMEVVIKTAKAPLRIHGDTIEYDATTFKVPPGSTVEDLLRRLPGIELDAEGNIKAQGKDVNKVYVDGKTFFGSDPKAATKNLGAETISKVQVYNEKSEQAQLTGIDDGKKEKAMNLELKDEFKKGSFGKITGAVGTEDRLAGRGNYNRFNEKEQLSFIAYGNNINETGVNWEDYGEFKGQNTFNNEDNGDFGFSQGGRYYTMGNDGDIPIAWFDGRGFTKNFGGGTNYNFDSKKTKFNINYFYNQSELTVDQFTDRQTFLTDTTFFNTDTTGKVDFRGNHSLSTRIEQKLDSNNLLIIKASGRIGNTNGTDQQYQIFSDENGKPVSFLNVDNTSGGDYWRVATASIYRHKFKKKGRSFAISGGYNQSVNDNLENLLSNNSGLAGIITQDNNSENDTRQLKSSLLFTEPITKRWFWETFYNFNQTDNYVNRQVADPENAGQRIDSLSIFYKNKTLYNRIGSVVRYSHEGLNFSLGLAGQQIQLDGEYARDRNEPLIGDPINRKFNNLVPNIDFEYEFANNMDIGASYEYNVQEPSLQQLQPIPNVNNPAFRYVGNPDLTPETSHSIGLNMGYWNPGNFSSMHIWTEYNIYDSRIVQSQSTEFTGDLVRVTSQPQNVSGGTRFSSGIWSSYPIIKTKFTVNLSGNINFNNSPVFVDAIETVTNSQGYSIRSGFSITPNKKLILGLNGNFRFDRTSYDINEDLTQNIQNHTASASIKWMFIDKTFLESNFDYSLYKNDRFTFDRNVSIFNASIRRLLGKSNRLELRLSAFDILNQRVNISQYATLNYVTRSVAPTLARYYMVSLSYNVRGYENKVKSRGWW
ncbi:MAG: TonB-dependent receptor [Lewinellaceae bacterium]|nr:TonB-dependent receptor [Saprospiraceae bacterium]MCB9345447.1 TonB-dependent receptor [Lewinellaceae bacterium]